jgi:glycosyltransferase involved in cell wall biosynthesis
MPAYNQAQTVGAAIESVLAQTFADWELIVVDDGSTDETAEVVGRYADNRIHYCYQANQERSRARNNGIARSRGGIVAFLDADDFWLPEYLAKQTASFRQHPEAGLSRTWTYDTDAAGVVVRLGGNGASEARTPEAFLAAMLVANRMSSIATAVRAACLAEVGGFNPDLRQGEDWELWVRILRRYPAAHVPEPLVGYRHDNVFMPPRLAQRGYEQAWVAIVERNFAGLEDSPLYALRQEALGTAHWRAAWNRYALNDLAAGQASAAQARVIYPELFGVPERFVESVAYLADELYDLYTPLDEALKYIDRLFENLPPALSDLRSRRRAARGRYCGLHVFRGYEMRQRGPTRRAAALALRDSPRWAANRGFWSITWRAVSGWGWRARPPIQSRPH